VTVLAGETPVGDVMVTKHPDPIAMDRARAMAS
jgi:hypothetical protein